MKKLLLSICLLLSLVGLFTDAHAAGYSLAPLTTFGSRGDGSIQPSDNPPFNIVSGPLFDINFNQRGLAVDPVTTNVVIVDTHSGSGGSSFVQGGIYVLDGTYGTNLFDNTLFQAFTLNTNGISGGNYADSPAVVSDDGVVYVANQVIVSTNLAVMIYRWESTTTTNPPVIAFSNTIAPGMRLGVTMDIRGTGANAQIIMGTFNTTNVVVFTNSNGTNFFATVLATDSTTPDFIEGICWGAGDTFWSKSVGDVLRRFSFSLATSNAVTLNSFTFSQLVGSDNLGPIQVDTNRNLLAAIEETSGITTGGPEHVWLYDITDPSNPILRDIKDFTPNNPNATAPPGYVRFSKGRLYAHVSNNGMIAYNLAFGAAVAPVIARAPAATNRLVQSQSIGLTVLAYADVFYQWLSNNVPISGATTPTLTLVNVTTNFSAKYTCVVTNTAGSTNVDSYVEVVNPTDLYHLNLVWRAGPGDGKAYYTPSAAAGTPNQRSIGYSALSNHVYIMQRQSGSTSNFQVFAIDAANGNALWNMKTNGITCAVGQGGIGLAFMGVSDDGSIYAANIANNANGDGGADPSKLFRIYRWADGDSNTLPVNIFMGDPSLAPNNAAIQRWGDSLHVRGAGTNTQIIVDCSTKQSANTLRNIAIIYPTDSTMTNWASEFMIGTNAGNVASTTTGHSIQFDGANNRVWQKVGTVPLTQTTFDPGTVFFPGPPAWISATIPAPTYSGFSNRLCGVGLDSSRNLAAGVIKPSAGADTDSLALYDVSSLAAPLLLAQYNFPTSPHLVDANLISHTFFSGSNLFTLSAGNGIMVFNVAQGPPSKPTFTLNPSSLRLIQGGAGSMSAATLEASTLQWQKDAGTGYTNLPGATGGSLAFANAQLSDAANYRVIATNDFTGSGTSTVAFVSVSLPGTNYSLNTVWSIGPVSGNGNVVTPGGGGVPNVRSFGYGALSNHLYVPARLSPGSSSNYVVYVLDASTGAILSTLNTNGLYKAGAVGEGGVGLVSIAAAGDGNIYACNAALDACGCGPNAGATPADSLFRLYRWAGEGSTLVQVFSGDPAGSASAVRWGDTMTVRGSGINTEILLDSGAGNLAAILKPTDATLNTFTNVAINTAPQSPLTIGRSLQFSGATNAFWQKRAQSSLRLSSYNLAGNSSATLATYPNFPIGIAAVGMDFAKNLLVGVETNGLGAADSATLIETSDLNTPMVIARYAFPTTGGTNQANPNAISHVEWAGTTVWALDANNGLVAFSVAPTLTVTMDSSGTLLTSWPNTAAGFTLQATPSLVTQVWTNVSTGTIVGNNYVVTNTASSATLLYRLKR